MENYIKAGKIGEGTYGVVYKVKDKRYGRTMALKKIRIDSEEEVVPWTAIREIALLKLKHGHIVRLEDVLLEGWENIYLVFEFVSMDLKEHLDSIQLDEEVVNCYPVPLPKAVS